MTLKERLHKLVDELSEIEADDALRILVARHKNGNQDTLQENEASDEAGDEMDEPEMVGLPEHLKTFEDGTPVPNWVAGLDEVRNGR